eukprot:468186-Amphidinium_carterae.1
MSTLVPVSVLWEGAGVEGFSSGGSTRASFRSWYWCGMERKVLGWGLSRPRAAAPPVSEASKRLP